MTEFIEIQIKVCKDLVSRMDEAIKQNCEADFNSEKAKLLDVLSILKTAAPAVHERYSTYASKTFA